MSRETRFGELTEELERRLVAGLRWEWQNAVRYYLATEYHFFRPPIFAIRDMAPRGSWNRQRYEIALARDFIMTSKWEDVVQVLLHEMAHQYVSVFLGEEDRPHGRNFRQACHIFRIPPQASIATEAPDEDNLLTSNDRIISKVRKLLALAQSSNQNEAESAMLKAQGLIEYYNLELLEQDEQRNYCSRRLGECRLRHSRDEYALFNFVTQFYFVHGITIRSFIVERNCPGSVFEISGTETNVALAHYVYDFMRNYITRCWELEHKNKGQRHRVDFALGVIAGFRDKLVAGKCGHGTSAAALIRHSDSQLLDYMKYRYPYRAKRRGGRRRVNYEAQQAGYRKGQEMVLHKGVASGGNRAGRLLGN